MSGVGWGDLRVRRWRRGDDVARKARFGEAGDDDAAGAAGMSMQTEVQQKLI